MNRKLYSVLILPDWTARGRLCPPVKFEIITSGNLLLKDWNDLKKWTSDIFENDWKQLNSSEKYWKLFSVVISSPSDCHRYKWIKSMYGGNFHMTESFHAMWNCAYTSMRWHITVFPTNSKDKILVRSPMAVL